MNTLVAVLAGTSVLLATVTNLIVAVKGLRQSRTNGDALNGQHAAAMTEIQGLRAAVLDAGGTVPVITP